jgi:hypothetical protein
MPVTVVLSLISHTNIGKTTLARTLLRRDVGEVRDAPHVTQSNQEFELERTLTGETLTLWDTPGFGDSVRLLRRLRQEGNPIGWFLGNIWDRYTDRTFWSSQQAVRNVRDHSDVVLYLVNAGEDPASAAYVDAEMQLLEWIGKPVLVLLNQLGPPQTSAAEQGEVARWSDHLAAYPAVRGVLAFDAFARCWVQEHVLLERIAFLLMPEQRQAFAALAAQWRERNEIRFSAAMQVLAEHLTAAAADSEPLPSRGITATARDWLGSVMTGREVQDADAKRAMTVLASRLEASLAAETGALLALHELEGSAAAEINTRLGEAFAIDAAVDPGKAGLWGAAISGALGGLIADIASGGLTFGAGALLGGVAGAFGMRGIARAYNLARGNEATLVRWAPEFLDGRVNAALLRYLAVAHYGRGRGDFVQTETPAHWRQHVEKQVVQLQPRLQVLWQQAGLGTGRAAVVADLQPLLESACRDLLDELYGIAEPTVGVTTAGR